jgi:hypothetical protein
MAYYMGYGACDMGHGTWGIYHKREHSPKIWSLEPTLTQKITVPLLHPRHVESQLVFGPEINRIVRDLQQGHGFGWFPLCVRDVVCQRDGRDHRVEV